MKKRDGEGCEKERERENEGTLREREIATGNERERQIEIWEYEKVRVSEGKEVGSVRNGRSVKSNEIDYSVYNLVFIWIYVKQYKHSYRHNIYTVIQV